MRRVADLPLPPGVRRRLREEAERAYPDEACGAILGRGDRVTGVRPLANRSSRPSTSYEIAPSDVEALLRDEAAQGPTVLGFYHSHPDAEATPSRRDRETAWPAYLYVIVDVREGVAGAPRTWRSDRA